MTDNSTRSDPTKKCYTLSISEEEIEKQLSIIFDSQICTECGQDHSFKNNFENVKTSIDYLPVYSGSTIHRIAISTGGKKRI